MAITTPTPGEILKDQEVTKTGFITGRTVTPAQVSAAERARKNYVPVSRKIANTLENRQAKSFARLAEDTLIEADRRYEENPTPQNKAKWDSAYADFVKATTEYKNITNSTYETNKVKQEYVGELPAEPKGFDPLRDRMPGGAQTPGDRAKIDGAPDYVPPNTLDNSRWNPNSFTTGENAITYLYTGGNMLEPVPVAFVANENGSIYQDKDGNPTDLTSYVDKVISEYSNAGKMNELRSLLVKSKVLTTPSEIAFLDKAKNLEGSDFSGSDYYTREAVKRAVQFTTMSNIFASGLKTNKPKFESLTQFLNGYQGELNYYIGQDGNGYGGGGTPRRTVSLTQQIYTPEDLELNIDAFFQEYTGQGASQEDVDYLVKRLNAQDPQKTVTTNSGNTSKSVTTGGVSQMEEQNMMREMALSDPAAESYNKATTYLDYFRKALASPIDLGA
jgi:flagellar motor protein MotB